MSEHFDVVIIGAGAAGLMCAAEAGKRGPPSIGGGIMRKNQVAKFLFQVVVVVILAITTLHQATSFVRNPHFVKSALSQYTNWDFISMVSKTRY